MKFINGMTKNEEQKRVVILGLILWANKPSSVSYRLHSHLAIVFISNNQTNVDFHDELRKKCFNLLVFMTS